MAIIRFIAVIALALYFIFAGVITLYAYFFGGFTGVISLKVAIVGLTLISIGGLLLYIDIIHAPFRVAFS